MSAVRQFDYNAAPFTACALDAYAANHDLIVTYESDVLANATNRKRSGLILSFFDDAVRPPLPHLHHG
jgi:hypothetical protein